jgi:hypothetical protein
MTARQLAALLRPFGIRSITMRVGEATPKGYALTDFEDSFARYLSDSDPQHSQQINDDTGMGVESDPQHQRGVADAKAPLSLDEDSSVADVAHSKPEMRVSYEF